MPTRRLCFISGMLFATHLFTSASALANSSAAAGKTATRLLQARKVEFKKEIIKLTDNLYTAVGYAVSPVSMIIGKSGIVIIDTGMDQKSAQQIRQDFKAITDQPVKAIVFTHGHGDHTGGAAAFVDSADVQVWAREGFGEESNFAGEAGLKVHMLRGARQGGFMLKPAQRINNGIAQAYWPERGAAAFGTAEKVKPNHLLKSDRQAVTLAGIDLELVAADGETKDGLYVWYPAERVVFSGDNFYKSWPNLYAIRGSAYRDVRQWAIALDRMLGEKPAILVGGHTRPIVGEAEVAETLTNYRDAIDYVFNKTIEGMNKGMTPNQLVEYVKLPDKFAELDYLKPYYGNPEWAVRSIFDGYLGWFDGNATNLFPLSDKEEASRIAELAGGAKKVRKQAGRALDAGDAQWAAQLCDYLLALDPNDKKAMLTKADALTALAESLLTATGRNYYLTSAMELRMKASGKTFPPRPQAKASH